MKPNYLNNSAYSVEIEHLSHVFIQGSEKIRVLDDMTLKIKSGELVGVIGPSGSGKSTLLHLMALLMPCQQGVIKVNGVNLQTIPWHQRCHYRGQNIGFVFQSYSLLQDFSVYENIMIAARLAGLQDTKALNQAESLLVGVGLENRRHHRPYQLSGGEQQRAALVRALVHQPSLILADEPTGNLDKKRSTDVFKTLKAICQQEGSTLVLVTHDEDLVQCLDRCYRLDQGKLFPTCESSKKLTHDHLNAQPHRQSHDEA